MKSSTFAKTALSTLVALSLGACSHNSAEKGFQPSTKVVESANVVQKNSNSDLTELKGQLNDIQNAIGNIKGADTSGLEGKLKEIKDKLAKLDKLENTNLQPIKDDLKSIQDKLAKLDTSKLEKEIGTDKDKKTVQAKLDKLQKAIEELKKAKTTQTTKEAVAKVEEKVKKLEKEKKEVEEKVAEVKKAKETAEKKAKKLEDADKKEKKYVEELPFKVTDTATDTKADTKRALAESVLTNDKFSFQKVFEGKAKSSNNYDVEIVDAVEPIKVDIDGKEYKVDYHRYDLKYSKIASLGLPGSEDGNWDDEERSYVNVYSAKATTVTEEELKDLKANNKDALTYRGRSFLAVKEISENVKCSNWQKPCGPDKRTGFEEQERDMFRNEGAGDAVFTVDLGKSTITGTLDKFARDGVGDATVALSEGKIAIDKADSNKLKFSGVATVKQGNTENDVLSYAKDGTKGTFEGVFAGPKAEELAGRFDIKDNEYFQKGNTKSAFYEEGQGKKYGEIRGVFNAKKEGKESKKYQK